MRFRRYHYSRGLSIFGSFPMQYSRNIGLAGLIFPSYKGLTKPIGAHGFHICDLVTGESAIRSNRMIGSAFLDRIHNVFSVCSKKKMARINASGIITFMQYMKVAGVAIVNLIRHSMCFPKFALKAYLSISGRVQCAAPYPALFLFAGRNKRVKRILYCGSSYVPMSGNKTLRFSPDPSASGSIDVSNFRFLPASTLAISVFHDTLPCEKLNINLGYIVARIRRIVNCLDILSSGMQVLCETTYSVNQKRVIRH